MSNRETVKQYAGAVLAISLFFWIWALTNTIGMEGSKNFDLGVVSFGTTALSSAYLLWNSRRRKVPSSTTRICLMVSQMFVALNYALGSYLGFGALGRPGFGIYCAMFALIWIGIALVGVTLLKGIGSSSGGHPTESLNLV